MTKEDCIKSLTMLYLVFTSLAQKDLAHTAKVTIELLEGAKGDRKECIEQLMILKEACIIMSTNNEVTKEDIAVIDAAIKLLLT